jgi:alkaline phosphatase
MKTKNIMLILVFALLTLYADAQGKKKIRNVIMMIPDGTSTSVLSISRWYNSGPVLKWLSIDPYVCGLVKTHSSNAPIGDSAPTSSWYATGYASQTGFIATYPPQDDGNDLVKVDKEKAYQPLMTVLEAAKLSGKKTGLVFTCQFPHATPADFSAHSRDRNAYHMIAEQMIHNRIDVLFGGGTSFINKENRQYLAKNGYDTLFIDDKSVSFENGSDYKKFKQLSGSKAWALFSPVDVPNDIDRNPNQIPSLAEMTQKALELLSKDNKQGFFMMIEGSKVDWSAHNNDPIGVITEFLAFDKAVGTAIAFAKAKEKEGVETIIVICPDHGNSGINMGSRLSNSGYDKLSYSKLYGPLKQFKLTADGIAKEMVMPLNVNKDFKADSAFLTSAFRKGDPSIVLTAEEIKLLQDEYAKLLGNAERVSNLVKPIAKIITSRTYIGFTTNGHTGEDVFLAVYPTGTSLHGVVGSDDINRFFCTQLSVGGVPVNLNDSTTRYFSRHTEVLKGYDFKISGFDKNSKTGAVLEARKGDVVILIPANKNELYINGVRKVLNSVVIYDDVNNVFYLPKTIVKDYKI